MGKHLSYFLYKNVKITVRHVISSANNYIADLNMDGRCNNCVLEDTLTSASTCVSLRVRVYPCVGCPGYPLC